MSFSQAPIYKHFGVDDGLPSSEVYDIYQDKEGYIWFATDKGLSRFNGYEFENFTTKDGLLDNTILDFYPQENGQVWAYGYHSQSLFYFDDVFDGFKTYEHNDILKQQLNPSTILKSIVVDEKQTLFIGGYGLCGLIEITKEGQLIRQYDLNLISDTPTGNKDVNLGIQTKNGVLFSICSDYKSTEDVLFINPEYIIDSRLELAILNDNESIFIDKELGVLSKNGETRYYNAHKSPVGIKRINDHLFFVGYYNNGAEIRDVSGEIIERFLPKKTVTNFLIDTEGSYWFSTLDDDVFYVKNPNLKVYTEQHVTSIVKNDNNVLYAGFYNGNIIRITQKRRDTLYKAQNTSHALVEFDNVHNVLYGYSEDKLMKFAKQKHTLYTYVRKFPEHIGKPLLRSITHGFSTIENDSITLFSLNQKVQDVCMYKNDVLIGTSSGLFIQKDSIIKPYQPVDILKSRIDDLDVNHNTNTVYIATQGSGVVVYGDSIYSINKEKGLTNDIVSEVHIENDSIVWACTNSGLNRIAFKTNNTYSITTITKADGLLSNDIDDVEIINDTVWVATKKGLCYFKKEVILEKEASKILSLTLKDVSVNNVFIDKDNIKLKYNQNNIDFTLQAISHKNTNNINYLYRLKEIDSHWTSTRNRKISFPSLSPGNYTFEAKASLIHSLSDNQINYNFKIRPPFWKSWWFYSLCTLLFAGLVYLFFKIRVLTYNKDIIRELIRLTIKRLKRKEQFYNFRSNGEDFKIPSHDILHIKSQGNYLDISTTKKTYTIRCKIGDFIATTPDALEYLRVHRSYIIRIDQVSSKGKNWVVINGEKIPVGETYLSQLEKIQF
ncbi:LytTR family transcriptional regulator DNA-binding domain-containing protein [Psychroserpens sp. AS72]|uniref:ligand-binding sensor domain-containing protein n=1 Tax=Psychroserpens sp. AS72 TaxID=3135775 RepID=UPI0031785725